MPAILLLAGCASLGPHAPNPQASAHQRLQALCAENSRPADASVGSALDLSAEQVVAWRRARSIDPDQVCGLSDKHLARSLAKWRQPKQPGTPLGLKEYIESFYRDESGNIPGDGLKKAIAQRVTVLQSKRDKAGGISGWTAVGPEVVAGRVRALLYDRADNNRVYLGAATGGIWTSTDGGNNWSPVNDFAASLTISSLAQDPNDINVLYAGTGEWGTGFRGIGILKSTDRGASWNLMSSTSPSTNDHWTYVQQVATHPSNSSILFAATWSGIFRSGDGGASWQAVHQVRGSDGYWTIGWRILFAPGNSSRVLVALSNGQVALSTDGGLGFSGQQLGSMPDLAWQHRVSIGWAQSQASVAYALVDEHSGDLYRSADGGANWALVSNPAPLGEQGWYDNVIWVDPTNPSTVVVGGIDLHRSTDAGATFSKISDWRQQYYINNPYSAHADHHVIVNHPGYNGSSNRTVLFGTDGGVYRADNVLTVAGTQGWQYSGGGLVTTQFYAISGKNDAGGLAVIGGTQDNSTFVRSPNILGGWQQPGTGDGGPGFFDPLYPTRVYYSAQRLLIGRWNVADGTGKFICEGITEAYAATASSAPCGPGTTGEVRFIAPYLMDPENGERLYAGAASLWLTENARSGLQPSWRIIKEASQVAKNYISAIAMRPGEANRIWVGHENGDLFFTANALGFSPSWQRVFGPPNRIVTSIVFDPSNNQRLFVTFGGFSGNNLWTTDNYGSTWRSISSGLPAAPIYTMAVHPTRPNVLYVGTEVGLFVSEDSGTSWNTQNDGPAATLVRTMFFADSQTLVVGTYGRGIWQTTPYASSAATIDVVEFYNSTLNHYFVSGGSGEIAIIESGGAGPGWSRTGDSFKAFSGPSTNALPVCRFYGNPEVNPATGQRRGPNSHFYTINAAECEGTKNDPGWVYEGISFYAYPPGFFGGCSAGQVSVYRLYNNRYMFNDSNHRFTTRADVYSQMQAAGWSGEGVQMCAPAP